MDDSPEKNDEVSSSHALRIVAALQKNVGHYKAVHGAIEPDHTSITPASTTTH